MKKAQGMPMNVIVIAALVLLVLIVLALIFSGKTRSFAGGVESCQAKGGVCNIICEPEKGMYQTTASDCPDACCIDPWRSISP